MILIVFCFALGIALGVMLRGRRKLVRTASHASDVCVFFLLFILGVSIGRNEKVISNLPSMGITALLLSLGAVAGSLCLTFLVEKIFFGRSGRDPTAKP
ncbi:MAG: LysO family transporter, partial [Desulfovibrionales bacterium]